MKLAKITTLACAMAATSFAVQAKTHVDILVAFDTTAVAAVEADSTTLQAFAEGQIAKANEVLVNSGLSEDFDFRLAGTYEWAFTHGSAGGLSGTLAKATDKTEPTSVAMQTARDEVGADIVVVIVKPAVSGVQKGASNGLAPEVNGARQYGLDFAQAAAYLKWFSDIACSVVDYNAAANEYTFVHEVGHVMGAGHSEIISNDTPGPQLYSYSSAWMVQGNDGNYYATLMGYNRTGSPDPDAPTYTVLPYFSSPDLLNPETGEPMGNATHDNVQTLRNSCVAVSNFRASKLPDSGSSPSADSGSTPSADSGSNSGNGSTNVRPVPTPKPVTPAGAQFTAKKTTIDAAVVDDGQVVGIAQFVVAATRNGISKVSGKITGLDGKKKNVKSTKCTVYGEDVALVDLSNVIVKGLDGTLSVTLGSDGSLTDGKIGSLSVVPAQIGVSGASAYFWIEDQISSILGDSVIASVTDGSAEFSTIPYAASPEEIVFGKKWTVAKASRIKVVRDRDTGMSSLVPSSTTNLSGLKLNYQAKTGIFKGSFTVYALNDAGKLKRHKFNVTGVAVNGEGVGIAVCKKPGITLPVSIGEKPELPAPEPTPETTDTTTDATPETTPGSECSDCGIVSEPSATTPEATPECSDCGIVSEPSATTPEATPESECSDCGIVA